MTTVSKVCMAVEINGKAYFVNLPQDRMLSLLIPMTAALADNGQLNVYPAPDGFEFKSMAEIKAMA